jgi:orotate phosphoribosyltransferase
VALEDVVSRIRADIVAGKTAVDAVVGPALGGIIVAYELGRQLGFSAFFTERDEKGSMTLRRGFEVTPGMNILIAEDVITTGKSLKESAAVLEKLGANIAALACIVDRRAPGKILPWPLYAAATLEATDWEKDSCKLCQKGIPTVKPGSRKF